MFVIVAKQRNIFMITFLTKIQSYGKIFWKTDFMYSQKNKQVNNVSNVKEKQKQIQWSLCKIKKNVNRTNLCINIFNHINRI
jgi:hypothetical protein